MNNIAKFNETQKALQNFQKQISYLEEKAQEKLEKEEVMSKKYLNTFLEALQTKELTINKKDKIVNFDSTTLGSYTQVIWKSKTRMYVVPLCFLFQLYKENLEVKEILANDDKIDIPFTLRGFWQMDNAVKLLNDIMIVQIDAAQLVEKQIRENKKDKKRVKELKKVLQVIESLEISVMNTPKKQLYQVQFEEHLFNVNKKNRKLDIVPLCKMLTSYYVRIIDYIEEYKKMLGNAENKEDICQIQDSYKKLMEKYFTIRMLNF